MTQYLTIMADLGDMSFDEKLRNALDSGWAVYNIWGHPQKKVLPSVKQIIVTLIKSS